MRNTSKSSSKKKLREKRTALNPGAGTKKCLSPKVLNKLRRLKKLLKQQDSKCWEIGDICIELIDRNRLSLRQISEFTNYSRARISHFHLTSRAFPAGQRERYTFQDSLTARQICMQLPRLNMSQAEMRDAIVKLRNKTPRQVRAHFVQILTEREINQSLAESVKNNTAGNHIINNCHCADWRDIVPKLPNNSAQLFICDPPFAQYGGKGGYISHRTHTNGMRNDCENNVSEEEALSVTLPLFDLCLPKLAQDGILLLFQGGAKCDRVEVLQTAYKCGWDCVYALTWYKGKLSMGSFRNPYFLCSEKILVFCRKGMKLKKFQNGMPHPNILDFPTETNQVTLKMNKGKMKFGDYHQFQKPPQLMEFLIRHHSYPGDMVVTPFGCSGVGAISALKLGRQWVYVEKNKNNYSWGSQRVMKALEESSVMAG